MVMLFIGKPKNEPLHKHEIKNHIKNKVEYQPFEFPHVLIVGSKGTNNIQYNELTLSRLKHIDKIIEDIRDIRNKVYEHNKVHWSNIGGFSND